MFKKLLVGIAWVWAWASVFLVTLLVISGLADPLTISGFIPEFMAVNGMIIIGAFVATKLIAYVAGLGQLAKAIIKSTVEENTNIK